MFKTFFHTTAEQIARLWFSWIFVSCGTENYCSNSGIVLMKTQSYKQSVGDYTDAETYFPSLKIWFKDSIVIQQIKSVYFEARGNKTTKREVRLVGFTFIHLPSRTFFHYKTFADTAKPVARWTASDSAAISMYGGWLFYKPYSTPRTGSAIFLADTVCSGILYKRAKFNDVRQGIRGERTFYYRCDKKGTMFQFDKELSETLGCPITMIESETGPSDPNRMRSRIDFVSDRLSDEELKVFAAWEKNADDKAVQK